MMPFHNSLYFVFWNFKSQQFQSFQKFALHPITGYNIFMVYNLFDHNFQPMSAQEFPQLLYKVY